MKDNTKYTVLSPWAKTKQTQVSSLAPRLESLDGKTIGMFYNFKAHCGTILNEVSNELSIFYPKTKFSFFQYPVDTKEINEDPSYYDRFLQWVKNVDAVIAGYGDAGSCAMFLSMNVCLIEKTGKPTVMFVKSDLLPVARRSAAARMLPELRFVTAELVDLSLEQVIDEALINGTIRPAIISHIQELADGLLRPLTEQEKASYIKSANNYADLTFSGSLEEINDYFYKMGWTNGLPINPPTKHAVDRMMSGTDLNPNEVLVEIPPMLGMATVEKIAVNAVMAGCLPVYMPVLIALIKTLVDPELHLSGWTCSAMGFSPIIIVSGPVSRQINLNGKSNLLTPYYRANAAIARAFRFILMNIGGIRPGLEDNCYLGHEGHFGVCIAESEEESPWAPHHINYGFNEEDSVVTLAWYYGRDFLRGSASAEKCLAPLCTVDDIGFRPGCTFIVSPQWAKTLADAGFTREDVINYICEYSRKTSPDGLPRWLVDNNHIPSGCLLPMGKELSHRRFWNTNHLQLFVGGGSNCFRAVAFTGGGDHGGPSHSRIELPADWDELLKQDFERSNNPNYIEY